ncbi:MAG TPA: glycosyltransferase family 2 protein [Bacteroidota bacterium]|nr:glycosyltransferase family 2 protein [Bacteroidota bacterium]
MATKKREHQINSRKLISIVVPVLDEAENIREVHKRLSAVLRETGCAWEIIFVDDGSSDETLTLVEQIAAKDRAVKAISFSRNFGHQAALTAGLDAARGDAVITMDGDLQHPPALIPEMLKQWRNGSDIVYTIRTETVNEPLFKKLSSGLYYRVMNAFSDIRIESFTADFRLLSREVVEILKTMPERDRFLRGLIRWVGFTSSSISYTAQPRYAGKSKYTLRKMSRLALDGMLSFTAAPLHFVTVFGAIAIGFGILYTVYSLYAFFVLKNTVPGWTSLLISILFLGGVQLLSLGLIGEYLARIYYEAKQRPVYIIKRSIGVQPDRRLQQ